MIRSGRGLGVAAVLASLAMVAASLVAVPAVGQGG